MTRDKTLRCVDRVENGEITWEDCQDISSTSQTTLSTAKTAGDRLTVQLSTFYPGLGDDIQLPPSSPDSCRQLQGMTFFCIPTLALYLASDLNTQCIVTKSLSVAPRVFVCSYTYLQGRSHENLSGQVILPQHSGMVR